MLYRAEVQNIRFFRLLIADFPRVSFSTARAEILVGIQLDSDWDYLLQLGI